MSGLGPSPPTPKLSLRMSQALTSRRSR